MNRNPSSADSLPVFTPSALIQAVNSWLADAYPRVVVEGEIASLRTSNAGHTYFDLRDESAALPCALFARERRSLTIAPRNGMKVRASGRLMVYAGSGRFQLVVERLEDAGEGELLRAFLALKSRLEAEGLFDPARKPRLPKWPRRLALLTSRDGAVLHDVLTILARRFPLLPIELYPVPVQGPQAARAIIDALRRVIARGRCDVVLIARGGGSLADLSAFNDEALARAIAASPLPVVSAVGHETDFTIADFVASLRAPTPSAAAEMIAPDGAELLRWIDALGQSLRRHVLYALEGRQQRLDELERMLRAFAPAHGPLALALEHRRTRLGAALRQTFASRHRRLDPVLGRLVGRRGLLLRVRTAALTAAWERLRRRNPSLGIAALRLRLERLPHRLLPPLAPRRARLATLGARLDQCHPRRRFERWNRRLRLAPLRLLSAVQGSLAVKRRPPQALRERLLHCDFRPRLVGLRYRLEALAARLRRALPGGLSQRRDDVRQRGARLLTAIRETIAAFPPRLTQASLGLHRLGPHATLRRGYAILRDPEGRVVSRAAEAEPGQALSAVLADGALDLRVEGRRIDEPEPPASPPARLS